MSTDSYDTNITNETMCNEISNIDMLEKDLISETVDEIKYDVWVKKLGKFMSISATELYSSGLLSEGCYELLNGNQKGYFSFEQVTNNVIITDINKLEELIYQTFKFLNNILGKSGLRYKIFARTNNKFVSFDVMFDKYFHCIHCNNEYVSNLVHEPKFYNAYKNALKDQVFNESFKDFAIFNKNNFSFSMNKNPLRILPYSTDNKGIIVYEVNINQSLMSQKLSVNLSPVPNFNEYFISKINSNPQFVNNFHLLDSNLYKINTFETLIDYVENNTLFSSIRAVKVFVREILSKFIWHSKLTRNFSLNRTYIEDGDNSQDIEWLNKFPDIYVNYINTSNKTVKAFLEHSIEEYTHSSDKRINVIDIVDCLKSTL